MDGERLLINIGVIAGFIAFMGFWLGLAMWLRVDADKHGMIGWVWAFVGIIAGPVALFVYLIIRGNRPVLEVVNTRDALLEESARTGQPSDFNPAVPAGEITDSAEMPVRSPEAQAALEAEERRFKSY